MKKIILIRGVFVHFFSICVCCCGELSSTHLLKQIVLVGVIDFIGLVILKLQHAKIIKPKSKPKPNPKPKSKPKSK
jgi:hypothetical protein